MKENNLGRDHVFQPGRQNYQINMIKILAWIALYCTVHIEKYIFVQRK